MMTLSQPMAAFQGIQKRAPQPQPPKQTKFGGEQEYQQFLGKMREFPDDTIERLNEIVSLGAGPAHIKKAKELGKEDGLVKWFNDQVTGFISKRRTMPDAHEHLDDLRRAFKTVREEKGLDKKLDRQA